MEWAIITLITSLVLIAEMVNTVIEVLMDHMFKEFHEVAKITKDLGAGFVLISAIAALIIFVLIFGHRLSSLYVHADKMANTGGSENSKVISESEKLGGKNKNEDEFYGSSMLDNCDTSFDCKISGCNSEICGTEELSSICLAPEGPLPKDLGYKCSCIQSQCQWYK